MLQRLRAFFGFVLPWVGANLARVVAWTLVVAIGFGAVLGVACYAAVREEGAVCQGMACGIVVLGTLVFGVAAGAILAAVRSLRGWVVDSRIGPMVSQALFAQTLGVTDRRPEGKSSLTESLHGMTRADAQVWLQNKFSEVFSGGALNRWLPAPGRWLVSRVVNGAGWAATRYALAQAPGDEDSPVDLLALRDAIGSRLEEQAIGMIAWRARGIAWAVLVLGGGVVVGLVFLVRWGFGLVG